MSGPHLRQYGIETTIAFDLFEQDGVSFRTDAVYAAGDVKIMKDEGAEANTTNGFTDEGQGYSIVLTATEMQANRIVLYLVDQTATKVWMDKAIVIETRGPYYAIGWAIQSALNLITWQAWCDTDGVLDLAATNCRVKLYKINGDNSESEVSGATETVATPTARGTFSGSMTVNLTPGVGYYFYVQITVAGADRNGNFPVAIPVRTA